MDDLYSLLVSLRTDMQAGFAELRDVAYNTDTMLRALCYQGNINLSTLRLRTPAVPLFADTDAATPSASSVASVASTSSSSLHIARMTLESPQLSGTPELPSDAPQAHGTSFKPLEHWMCIVY